ncbi:hypothetical protein AGR7A_pAt20314 [Agrobacterium deltaense NCPPB 1641]|uniref:Uncharacterized protein n=1 Tax=Agrobacterium deltaense NCPPB 1641 TaxID=1183425 RepID=A0A1S7U9P0_9HYPH|nr:hypothetical protein AGR7A_pAt20314 [Agrobacterium deltaense NCPPB 1641]
MSASLSEVTSSLEFYVRAQSYD